MRIVMTLVALVMICAMASCQRAATDAKPEPEGATASADHPMPPHPLQPCYAKAEIREASNGVRDVFVGGDNVTRFANPHHIYAAEVSPSGDYLMVWHMDYAPRKVSIYDLSSRERIAYFEPGTGGRMRWADYDLIYHQYGAGTSTAFFNIFNVAGAPVWRGGSSGARLDASGKYVLVLPSLNAGDDSIQVLDVRDGRVLAQADKPTDFAGVRDYSWLDGRTVRVWYEVHVGVNSIDMRTIDIPVDVDSPITRGPR